MIHAYAEIDTQPNEVKPVDLRRRYLAVITHDARRVEVQRSSDRDRVGDPRNALYIDLFAESDHEAAIFAEAHRAKLAARSHECLVLRVADAEDRLRADIAASRT